MSNFETSYSGLFNRTFDGGLKVRRIEIPLIQRDFAQGRLDPATNRIRQNFLEALVTAVTEGPPLSLDFVYGETEGELLLPLDGQQRLTTLFLLHWYLAARCHRMEEARHCLKFTYATRASARLFCERMAASEPDLSKEPPSAWLIDQPWYQQTWDHDPTVQSMLVVLDDLHRRFAGRNCDAAWNQLTEANPPTITFHVLPMKDLGLSDDIYIKMNSRGKPLTEFELFKARFEKLLEATSPKHAQVFASKIDTDWTDLFWHAGSKGVVDSAMVRYIRFIADVCTWEAGDLAKTSEDLESFAPTVFGAQADAKASRNIELLLRCLDTWVGVDIEAWFSSLLVSNQRVPQVGATAPQPLVLFTDRPDSNLFAACCRSYDPGATSREFGWPEVLLLYATLLHRLLNTEDVHRRLRMVRNLIEGAANELRADRIPALLKDVRRIIVNGTLGDISAFNQKIHVADEMAKLAFREAHPELESSLFALEDHPLLRGCLVAFDLDEATFSARAKAFSALFQTELNLPLVTSAMLAGGDYSITVGKRFVEFGSSKKMGPWRALLRSTARAEFARTRSALGKVLDVVAGRGQASISDALRAFTAEWLADRESNAQFDWRYHFVRYPAMREGASGRYVGIDGRLGYSVCMLDKQQMNSYYRDPYLHAIRLESGVSQAIEDRTFTGYETEPRWMRLRHSGIALRVVPSGFAIRLPSEELAERAAPVLSALGGSGSGQTWQLPVDQKLTDGVSVDTIDRVQLGARLMRELVGAGM